MKSNFLSLLTRCRNEPYINEFVLHYLNEGVDMIYIITDNVGDYKFPEWFRNHQQIQIFPLPSGNQEGSQYELMAYTNQVYRNHIQINTTWLIFVDCDEFITSRAKPNKTIKQLLKTKFNQADLILVPWVFMSSNGRKKDPERLLTSLIHCRDQNRKHQPVSDKGGCSYKKISCKSIFIADKYNWISCHRPLQENGETFVVNGHSGKKRNNNGGGTQIYNFRNEKIKQALLVCYHYRIFSLQSLQRKHELFTKINCGGGYKSVEHMMTTDHGDLVDQTMANKCQIRNYYEQEKQLLESIQSNDLNNESST